MDRRLKTVLIIFVIAGFAALALFGWRAGQRAEQAEAKLPYETAKVLEATLAKSASLRVSTLTGRLVVTAADPGFAGLFPSNQKAVMPYAIDYFVDLGKLSPASFRWDAAANTMLIELPDVTVAHPILMKRAPKAARRAASSFHAVLQTGSSSRCPPGRGRLRQQRRQSPRISPRRGRMRVRL